MAGIILAVTFIVEILESVINPAFSNGYAKLSVNSAKSSVGSSAVENFVVSEIGNVLAKKPLVEIICSGFSAYVFSEKTVSFLQAKIKVLLLFCPAPSKAHYTCHNPPNRRY